MDPKISTGSDMIGELVDRLETFLAGKKQTPRLSLELRFRKRTLVLETRTSKYSI